MNKELMKVIKSAFPCLSEEEKRECRKQWIAQQYPELSEEELEEKVREEEKFLKVDVDSLYKSLAKEVRSVKICQYILIILALASVFSLGWALARQLM